MRAIAREGTRGLRRRAFAAVHIQRQTHDKSSDPMLFGERQKLVRIDGEFAAFESLERRGDGKQRVRKSQPNGFFAEIKSQEALPRTERDFQFGK